MTARTVVDIGLIAGLVATAALWVSAYVLLRRARAALGQFAAAASKLHSVAAAVDTTDRPKLTALPTRRGAPWVAYRDGQGGAANAHD